MTTAPDDDTAPTPAAPTATSPAGRTNWKIFTITLTVAVAAAALLTTQVATATVPVSFAVSGSTFKVSASRLDGTGVVQYAQTVTDSRGARHPVAVTSIKSAKLTNMCQSVLADSPVGQVTVRITAGGHKPIDASNLVIDLDELTGNLTFTNVQLGLDAARSGQAPDAGSGTYSQQSSRVVINNVRASSWITSVGTFRLEGMKLKVLPGRHECF